MLLTLALCGLLAGCWQNDLSLLHLGSSSSGGSSADPPGTVSVSLQRVFPSLTFASPVLMLQAPADSTHWYVVQVGGLVKSFVNTSNASSATTFLDITDRVTSGGSLGLLSIAFHPDFPTDPRVFVCYTATVSGQLVTRLSSFTLASNATTLNAASENILFSVNQPQSNNTGTLVLFGPDGFLYLGLGDGGGSGDVHGTIGNAQNPNTLLGKIVRIDVDTNLAPYAIPAGNPYVGDALCNATGTGSAACPEIYALGLRNPWRYSFDAADGSLWIGDVGQDDWEEVDHLAQPGINFAGYNLGWRCREGAHAYDANNCGTATSLIDPVAEYSHSVGQAITGGYVYRGSAIPALAGRYVFADSVAHRLWNIAGTTTATLEVTGGLDTGLQLVSFGQSLSDELFAVDFTGGGLYQLSAP
jgi:glucose/arabinose dehydrogenase